MRHNAHPRYRPDIDGLRALAVLPVLGFHAFPAVLPGGFAGVDIFFVISGYLIGLIVLRSLQRGSFRFGEFYAHRARRIFPALALVLVASLAAGMLLLTPQELQQTGKHVAASAGFVQNFVLQREAGYFDTASDGKPLLHLWSLAVEEHFYLLFPLLAWGLWRLGTTATGLGLALAAGASLAWGMRNGIDAAGAFYWPHTRAWELLAGTLLAHWQASRGDAATDASASASAPESARPWQQAAAWAGLAAVLASMVLLPPGMRWPGAATLAPVLGAALLIAAGPQAWPNRRLLAWRPLVLVGLVSYPLYLWHWPLLAMARLVEGTAPPLALRASALGVSALLAWLTWRWVERPLRGRPGRGPIVLLSLALLSIGLLGALTWRQGGWPQRLPAQEARIQDPAFMAGRPWLPEQQQPECLAQFQPAVPQHLRDYVFCRNEPGERANTVLLGDSHAVSLYPGLVRALAGSPWQVQHVGASLTPPLWGFAAWAGSPATPELFALKHGVVQEMRRFVLEHLQLHTVILAARWPVYVHATEFGIGAEADAAARITGEIHSFLQPHLSDPADMFEVSLRATLADLTSAGRQVVLVLDSPELGFDIHSCVHARPWSWRAHAARTPCALPRAAYDERSRLYRQRVARVLERFPQVILVDGARPFCDAQWCHGMRNGEPLYYDRDHVSLAGATLMGQAVRQALEQAAR